jgi:ADP-heptose:LPS heptosyltransferase
VNGHTLVVRLDSMGDVLVCGPAIRAVAASSDRVTVLAGPRGAAAARLLPGVDAVEVWNCPWIAAPPAPAVSAAGIAELTHRLAAQAFDAALVLTSFHQSALPTALVLRMAGIARVSAISDDYPGALLDERILSPPEAPEPVRMLAVARAAGYELPAGDDGELRVAAGQRPPELPQPYVVLHPGADAPARTYPVAYWTEVARRLSGRGRTVVLTGGDADSEAAATIEQACPGSVINLCGRTDVATLAAVLRGAAVVAVGNTGPAHLAAAVGTPVVSLFAPVVSAQRWAPLGRHVVVLGDQEAPCRGSRARTCPVPGHPCLSGVRPAEIVRAVELFCDSHLQAAS